MSVYVDKSEYAYGRMVMCHMLADSPQELHAIAEAIGVSRRWYQYKASTPHYDIAKSKRVLALEQGALEVSRKQVAALIHNIRAARIAKTAEGLAWNEDIERQTKPAPSPLVR